MRRFIGIALGAYGYRMIEESTAADGVRAAFEKRPDLVLLDLGLPDADGCEVTRRVREWSKVPIIVISATWVEESKVRALDEGANDYLTKPFGAAELMARIRVALRNVTAMSEPDVVQLGDEVRVDFGNHIVTVRDKEVHLTPIEFKLLAALVRRGGSVVTHDRLMTEVWGQGQAQQASLRVHMAQLRQKIERQPARPRFLTTETGIGYRLRLR